DGGISRAARLPGGRRLAFQASARDRGDLRHGTICIPATRRNRGYPLVVRLPSQPDRRLTGEVGGYGWRAGTGHRVWYRRQLAVPTKILRLCLVHLAFGVRHRAGPQEASDGYLP